MVKVNFADVEEFKPLPKGTYHFAVTDAEVKELKEGTKAPGKDYWRLELTVQDGEYEGRTEHTNIFLPPEYEPKYLAALLRATIGQHEWTKEDLDEGEFDVELDDLVDNNLEFLASVQPQKDNKDFNNVGFPKPYDPDEWSTNDLLPE